MCARRAKFSREFMREVAMDYIKSGMSRHEIVQKYGLSHVQWVSNWVTLYLTDDEIRKKSLSLQPESKTIEPMAEKKEKPDISNMDREELVARIQALEKSLKESELKNLALNTMIDIAEEQGISIRKKSGAKP